jgi:hypothetical protein
MNIIKRFAKRRCHKKGRIDKKERKQKRMAEAILFKNSVLGKRSEQDQEPSPP